MGRENLSFLIKQEAPSLAKGSKSGQKKSKSKPVVIENLSSSSTESAYSEKIQLLINGLESLAAEVFSTPQIDIQLQQDFVLKPLLETFKQKNDLSHDLFMEARRDINRCIHEIGYHEILVKNLERLTGEIEHIHTDLKNIQSAIQSRQIFLLPMTNSETLTELVIDAQLKLQNTLEDFLNNISTLQIEHHRELESQEIKTALVSFIEELRYDFGKNSLVDRNVAEAFRIKCLQHLGEKTGFLSFRAVTKPLESDDIQYLVKNLFTEKLNIDPAILKRQFAFMHHLIAKIQTFPIRTINTYFNLTTTIEKTNKLVRKESGCIQEQINLGLLPELQKYLALFTLLMPTPNSVIRAKETRKELQELGQAVEQFFVQFSDAEMQQYYVATTSPTEKLNGAAKQRLSAWDSLQQIVSHLNETHAGIQKNLDTLNELQNRFNHLKAKALEDIHSLNIEYEIQIKSMENELREVLIDTEEALSVRYKYNGLDKNENNYRVQAELNSSYKFLHSLAKTNTSLENLLFLKRNVLIKLEGYIIESKAFLKTRLAGSFHTIATEFSSYKSPLLTRFNPFTDELQQDEGEAREALGRMNDIYYELDVTPGRNLEAWLNRLEKKFNIAHERITKRNHTCKNALEIERRLNTKAYQISIGIFRALEEEFLRILQVYLGNAIRLYPNDEELQKIKTCLTNASLDINFNWSKEGLDKIDTRLFILLSIYREFHRINNNYINKNLSLHSDKTYLQELIDKVEAHLHNNHMEALSDAKRPVFIQWLRIYVLRSLQTISHQIVNYLKRDESMQYRFFVTMGACQTEHKLVDTGNKAYSSLKALMV
ncbi:hypothetical protein [Legionella jamestowniensis]|uniref:Uncharacterized protein n=1 Tax=Legionella jamestowniensis TaxID=455 RepID=A0A0W0UHE3_9GAMM|nr:hypothetical protein [Legionella jamestowniensis]KTD07062.1 hypothetical protein Ljam_1257 [Legionella jamestowniensis]SFM03063.1 hypothetical protein SAMN02746073_0023 [Legionella jamestowniensis DSM 19215]